MLLMGSALNLWKARGIEQSLPLHNYCQFSVYFQAFVCAYANDVHLISFSLFLSVYLCSAMMSSPPMVAMACCMMQSDVLEMGE